MSSPSILKADAAPSELPPMPIDPSWILEGKPTARGTVLVQSADKLLSSGLWSCTAGKFKWTFSWDEFIRVLEGEVTITDQTGKTITLKEGDIAHFPRGAETRWHVPHFVKKVFTLRTTEPFVL